MRIDISPALYEKLKQIRAKQLAGSAYPDEVFRDQEVVIVTLGLGPAIYLGLDGRVITWDPDGWWLDNTEPQEAADLKDIAAALVIGARELQLPELMELMPAKPPHASICTLCTGKCTVIVGAPGVKLHVEYGDGQRSTIAESPNPNPDNWIVCPGCGGLGWM